MPQIPRGGIIPFGRNLLQPAYRRREYDAHALTCYLQLYVILSHFNTTVGHKGFITASLKNIKDATSLLKIKNQPFLSPCHVGDVTPTHLILKCQDLDNYFKPPRLSVCAWRWRQTRVGGRAALWLDGIFESVWPRPSSLTSCRPPEVSPVRTSRAKMWDYCCNNATFGRRSSAALRSEPKEARFGWRRRLDPESLPRPRAFCGGCWTGQWGHRLRCVR